MLLLCRRQSKQAKFSTDFTGKHTIVGRGGEGNERRGNESKVYRLFEVCRFRENFRKALPPPESCFECNLNGNVYDGVGKKLVSLTNENTGETCSTFKSWIFFLKVVRVLQLLSGYSFQYVPISRKNVFRCFPLQHFIQVGLLI